MTAAGCTFATGHAAIGAIVVGRAEGGFDLFNCTGLARDSIGALTGGYKRMLAAAKLRGAAIQAPGDPSGYYRLIDQNQVCDDRGTYGDNGYYSTDTTYSMPDLGVVSSCWLVSTYQWTTESGGGGGGGGGDDGGGTGGGGTGFPQSGPPVNAPTIVSLEVSPAAANVTVGDAPHFQATAYLSSDDSITGPAVDWGSSNPNVSEPLGTPQGTFSADAPGTTQITATMINDDVAGSATITVSETPEFDPSDTTCTARNLGGCLGRPKSPTQMAAITAALDTGFVRDTGACEEVREWLLTRPDSLIRDGQNYSVGKNADIRFAGDIGTQAVITIYNNGWNGTDGQSLTHVVMHEGFHWWTAVHGEDYTDNQIKGRPSNVDQHATGCIKSESQ